MVDHVRKSIRDAAVTDLTGLATTGANVFTSRLSSLDEGEMPGWYVMLRDESGDDDAVGTYSRTGDLVLEGWAAGGDGLEDKLDTMAAEAEAALYAADSELRGKLMNFGPPRTQLDLPTDEAARRIGKVRILIPVTYRTAITDPTTLV